MNTTHIITKGALHKSLNIPVRTKIPKDLLKEIVKSKPKSVLYNSTGTGKTSIYISEVMRKRANFALAVLGKKKIK